MTMENVENPLIDFESDVEQFPQSQRDLPSELVKSPYSSTFALVSEGGTKPVLLGNRLDKQSLLSSLDILQSLVYKALGRQVTLLVHGDAVPVLSLGRGNKIYANELNYIARVLPEECIKASDWKCWSECPLRKKKQDVRKVLEKCISETAVKVASDKGFSFRLSCNWMNSIPDIGFPGYPHQWSGSIEDPITISSLNEAELDPKAILYSSKGLCLVRISRKWDLALKLRRFTERDEEDLLGRLRDLLGTADKGIQYMMSNVERELPQQYLLESTGRERLEKCISKVLYERRIGQVLELLECRTA